MSHARRYATWVEIDLSAITQNVSEIRRRSSAAVLAVVKADGYGHGAVEVAHAALRGGASWLAVARVEEALKLRDAGLTAPILLLGYTPPERVAEAVTAKLSMTVWDPQQVRHAAAVGRALATAARLHLKIDTGMSRLGVWPEDGPALARLIQHSVGARFEGMFTHFARADEPESLSAIDQEAAFDALIVRLEAEDIRPPLVHAANSAASLNFPSTRHDMVRFGIAMYGLPPAPTTPLDPAFRPALTWKSVLTHIKTVPPGQGISYGHRYVTTAAERIGTIPVGYADGFRRTDGNEVLVRGRAVPVVGRVCMDQCMIRLDDVPEASVGDEVVLIGRQGDRRITAQDIGDRWGTIDYEVVCGIGARVPRVYPGLRDRKDRRDPAKSPHAGMAG